jgi:hypothetical protein
MPDGALVRERTLNIMCGMAAILHMMWHRAGYAASAVTADPVTGCRRGSAVQGNVSPRTGGC